MEGGFVRFHSGLDDSKCLQATHDGILKSGAYLRLYPCSTDSLQLFAWNGNKLVPHDDPTLWVVFSGGRTPTDGAIIIFKDYGVVEKQEKNQGAKKGWMLATPNGEAPSPATPVVTLAPTPTACDCGLLEECHETTNTCVPIACDTLLPQVQCCADTDCGDSGRFTCDAPLCVEINCDINADETQCCDNADCEGEYTCVSNTCIIRGNPRFTLTWFGDDDLDLHVITPGGAEIYYSNPSDSLSGGFLDNDDIPSSDLPGQEALWVENIGFPLDGSAPSRTYQYFVQNYDQIGGSPDSWTMEVYLDGGDNKGIPLQNQFGITEEFADSSIFTFELA
jgi:hypothetical protein